jgi:arabinofuranan 3-O-arabinosyltransferase
MQIFNLRSMTVARCWIAVAAIIYVIGLARQIGVGWSDGAGRPFGDDFVKFWCGAFLTLHGRAAEVL